MRRPDECAYDVGRSKYLQKTYYQQKSIHHFDLAYIFFPF
jgi:hypothetical protein